MDEQAISQEKSVVLVIYDNMGTHYFLILHSLEGGWKLPKSTIEHGESAQEAVTRAVKDSAGLSSVKFINKIENQQINNNSQIIYDIYIGESSMNVPVMIPKGAYDTYLWSTKDRVVDKLEGEDRVIFERVCSSLS